MDEEADAGDQGDEGQRQRVQAQADVDAQVPGGEPLVEGQADDTLLSGQAQDLHEDAHAQEGGGEGGGQAQPVAPGVGAAAGQQEEGGGGRGDGDEQPGPGGQAGGLGQGRHDGGDRSGKHVGGLSPQFLSRFSSSTDVDLRVRKMDTTMLRPTTTSAAATTMTKKAKT